MTNNCSINANMKNMKGFTLIELLVTMAVLAIVIAIGVPSLSNMSSGNRLTTEINRMAGDLGYARNEAANRNVSVSVISNNGTDWTIVEWHFDAIS